MAGDTVLIYYRATPYKEKFVVAAVGAPSAPVTIRGVLGPKESARSWTATGPRPGHSSTIQAASAA